MKNEKGYALVTVLLISVIFVVLALAFFGQSLNSTKQFKKVEKHNQSVALAEMGVEYFYQAVSNSFLNNRDIVDSEIQALRQLHELEDIFWTEDQYKTETIRLMIEKISSDLNVENKEITINSEAKFAINSEGVGNGYTIGRDGDKIKVIYISKGTSMKENTSLRASLSINLDGPNGGGAKKESIYTLPNYNSIVKPKENYCEDPASLNKIGCPSIIFTKDWISIESNPDVQDKTIYSNGTIEFKNMNKVSNIDLHASNFNVKMGNGQGIDNSFIEVEQVTAFTSHLRLDYSTLHTKDLIIGGDLDVNGGSFVYVENSADLSENGSKLTIDSKSKMCVGGPLIVGNKIDVYGKLYIKDDSVSGKTSGNIIYAKEDDFNKACGKPSYTFTWDSNIGRDIQYDYK